MIRRVRSLPGPNFDGSTRQEDEVVTYNGSCSCGAEAGALHCHLLFIEEESDES